MRAELEIVLIFTDLEPAEIVFEIVKAHPKAAVIFGCVTGLLLKVIRPKLRLVSPSTFPFEFAPRIPQLQ